MDARTEFLKHYPRAVYVYDPKNNGSWVSSSPISLSKIVTGRSNSRIRGITARIEFIALYDTADENTAWNYALDQFYNELVRKLEKQ